MTAKPTSYRCLAFSPHPVPTDPFLYLPLSPTTLCRLLSGSQLFAERWTCHTASSRARPDSGRSSTRRPQPSLPSPTSRRRTRLHSTSSPNLSETTSTSVQIRFVIAYCSCSFLFFLYLLLLCVMLMPFVAPCLVWSRCCTFWFLFCVCHIF